MDPRSNKCIKLPLLLSPMALALITMLVVHSPKVDILISSAQYKMKKLRSSNLEESENQLIKEECLALTARAKVNLDWLCSVETPLRYAYVCKVSLILT